MGREEAIGWQILNPPRVANKLAICHWPKTGRDIGLRPIHEVASKAITLSVFEGHV